MTKRQRKARIEQLGVELIAHMRQRFPAVELLSIEDWPTEGTILRVYAPYEDKMAILESVVDPIVDALVNEGLTICVLPVSRKSAQQAA